MVQQFAIDVLKFDQYFDHSPWPTTHIKWHYGLVELNFLARSEDYLNSTHGLAHYDVGTDPLSADL